MLGKEISNHGLSGAVFNRYITWLHLIGDKEIMDVKQPSPVTRTPPTIDFQKYNTLAVLILLICDSDLSAYMTAIPMSPDPDPMQTPFGISIEFKTNTTKSNGWTLIAQGTQQQAGQHKCCLDPASLANIAPQNSVAKLIF